MTFLPVNRHLRVLAVGEQQHQVAGGVEKVERLEQPGRLLDGQADRRALIRELHELGPVADQVQAEQDVVVVAGERRHDVGFVAEFDQADQIVILAAHPLADESLRCRDRREEGRFVRRLGVEVRGGEARHHARRRVDHQRDAAAGEADLLVRQRRVRIRERHHEERQSGQKQDQCAVADDRRPRSAAPVEHRRQRHLRAARPSCGSACARSSPSAPARSAQPSQ